MKQEPQDRTETDDDDIGPMAARNRWAAFSTPELKCLWPVNNETPEIEDRLAEEIEAELKRREHPNEAEEQRRRRALSGL